jgi:protein MpaA
MSKGWSSRLTCAAILAAVGISGCYEPEPRPRIIGEDRPVATPTRQTVPQYRVLGRSVQGRPIMAQILGDGDETTLIVATIQGDESAGTPLAQRLAEHLRENPDLLRDRRVIVLPVANPDGMAHKTRHNSRGVDLNRNFDAPNRQDSPESGHYALSEPESRAIASIIQEHKPDRIVSIHQRLQDAPSCIDYDGPAQDLAERMARQCGVRIYRFGALPGSLGSYAGVALRIPTITLELPRNAQQLDADSLWRQYSPALLTAITYPEQT